MATINYRGAHAVPVKRMGVAKAGKHKGEVKLKTLRQVGKRPKGSIDWRQPKNVH
jgi:hypothetical protein